MLKKAKALLRKDITKKGLKLALLSMVVAPLITHAGTAEAIHELEGQTKSFGQGATTIVVALSVFAPLLMGALAGGYGGYKAYSQAQERGQPVKVGDIIKNFILWGAGGVLATAGFFEVVGVGLGVDFYGTYIKQVLVNWLNNAVSTLSGS